MAGADDISNEVVTKPAEADSNLDDITILGGE